MRPCSDFDHARQLIGAWIAYPDHLIAPTVATTLAISEQVDV